MTRRQALSELRKRYRQDYGSKPKATSIDISLNHIECDLINYRSMVKTGRPTSECLTQFLAMAAKVLRVLILHY